MIETDAARRWRRPGWRGSSSPGVWRSRSSASLAGPFASFDGAFSDFGGLNCVADLPGRGARPRRPPAPRRRAPPLRDGAARPLGVGWFPAPGRAGEGLPPPAARRRPLARRHRPLSLPGGPAARLRTRASGSVALERRGRAAAAHRYGRTGRRAIRACSPPSPAGSAGWRPCRRSPGSPTTTCWSWCGDDRAGRAAPADADPGGGRSAAAEGRSRGAAPHPDPLSRTAAATAAA